MATRPKRRARAVRSASSASTLEPARRRAERVDADRAAELGRGHGSLPSASASRLVAVERLGEAFEPAGDHGQRFVGRRRIVEDVAPRRQPSKSAGAEGGEAAAERAHHPADMLADDIVADADLAQSSRPYRR